MTDKETMAIIKQMVADGQISQEVAEKYFPELKEKESEDEKIINALIRLLRQCAHDGYDNVVEGVGIPEAIAWLEKQGEQKSADKVEPKFKVGDWIITNKKHIWYVDETPETTSYLYRLINQYGKVEVAEFEVVDEKAKLWTIQDAKDGDVLEFCDHGRLVVGIVSYVNKTTGKVDVNCLLENNFFKVGNYYNLDTIKPHPATKEQRDLLFQKMKEAGYEWDAEKKKLKKIEQKPADKDERKGMNIVEEDMTPFQKKVFCIIDTTIEEEQGLKQVCDELLRLAHDEIMQKPAEWNKEDIFTLDFLVDYLSRIIVNASPEEYIDGLARSVTLLKAIKDGIIPRPHWKPTEEQMKCLSQVKGTDDHVGYVLCTLYNDLKKLTE